MHAAWIKLPSGRWTGAVITGALHTTQVDMTGLSHIAAKAATSPARRLAMGAPLSLKTARNARHGGRIGYVLNGTERKEVPHGSLRREDRRRHRWNHGDRLRHREAPGVGGREGRGHRPHGRDRRRG